MLFNKILTLTKVNEIAFTSITRNFTLTLHPTDYKRL